MHPDSIVEHNAKLHLADFSNLTPEQLEANILHALQNGKNALKNLENLAPNSKTALADIIAFDHGNLALDRAWGLLSHLNSVASHDHTRDTHQRLLPKLSQYYTQIGQHQGLFNRYQSVVNDTAFFATLTPARQRALTLALQSFELSGIALPADKQAEFAKLSSELSTLSAKFSDNVLDATQSYFLPLTHAQIQGLPESALTMLRDNANRFYEKNKSEKNESSPLSKGDLGAFKNSQYVATLDIPCYIAVMTYAEDRTLRETLYHAYVTRASDLFEPKAFDNAPIMVDILAKRQQKAQLLGFDNFAELSLATKMADDVATVEQFLRDLAEKARPFAQKDLFELKNEAKHWQIDSLERDNSLEPWDIAFLAEKVKQRKYNLSQEATRPYFPLPKVLDGLFAIMHRLYNLSVQDKSDEVARWHDEVKFYALYDEKDKLIGGFYFDLYTRQGKRGGAWMNGFQPKYALKNPAESVDSYEQLPVCFMVGNFTPPPQNNQNGTSQGQPSLLTHDEVTTLFHEFGHGLHHLLTEVSIGDVAGVNGVEWDAVELPSQFMENWAWHADGLALISGHVDTGDTLPDDMLNAMLAAKNFQSGMQALRQIEFSLFDLLLHSSGSKNQPAPDYDGILAILDTIRADIALMPTPSYNRFANSFSHIFAGGYAAGYYSYKWAELLSADAFSRFESEGIFNRDTGKAFREQILAKGGSLPAKQNFEAFMGREARIEALLRHSGFLENTILEQA